MDMRKSILGSLVGAALGVALAVPAGAGTIYHWRTDEGGYAFADDLKRVPARYRDRVETRETASIQDYARFTPVDGAIEAAETARLEAEVARLRARNAELEARAAAPLARGAGEVEIRATASGEPLLRLGGTDAGAEPVVIERKRLRTKGLTTRTTTVVRQGDRVLAVIQPFPNDTEDLFFEGSLEDALEAE